VDAGHVLTHGRAPPVAPLAVIASIPVLARV